MVYLPLWKYEFVSWDDYSQYMETYKTFQTTNQLYDVYCMVMITTGVFIAHKMLYQIGVCYGICVYDWFMIVVYDIPSINTVFMQTVIA